MMIVPIEQDKLREILMTKGRAWVVGVYGMGKSLVAGWLMEEAKKSEDEVVKVSFKDLPKPESDDLPRIMGYPSYVTWHADWRRKAGVAKEGGRKLYIVIEEAQVTLGCGVKFWEVILSLSYYYEGTIYLLITATPAVLGAKTMALARLMRGSVLHPRLLNTDEIMAVVKAHEVRLGYPLVSHLTSIKKLSGGHYGTVKYLCQLIAENSYNGKKLTETKVISWARARGDMDYFLNCVWAGLSKKQQKMVRKWIWGRGKGIVRADKQVQELVICGLWYLGEGGVNWRIPWVVPFVREYVQSLADDPIVVAKDDLEVMGIKERRVVEFLSQNIGRVVTYDELGAQVYLENPAEFGMWALSQLVSRVRRKLSELGKGELLTTVRGQGYQWG
jgi:hypothetical protein